MKEKNLVLKERITDNLQKNRILTIGLIMVWIAVVVFTLFFYRDTLGKISSGNEYSENVIELSEGASIDAVIPINEECEALAIKFATFARKNNGSFDIKVIGSDSRNIYIEKTVKVSSLQDNAFATFAFSEILNPETDSKVEVFLSSDSEAKNGAGIYYSNLKAFENSSFTINGEKQEGDLTLRFLSDSEELSLFYHIIIVWVITAFTLIILMILLVKPRYEVLFTIIAVAFGLTFCLIITPMSVPDETIHYEYSFQLSNMIMGEKNYLTFNEEYQNYGSFGGHLNVSAAYARFVKGINKPLSLRDKSVKMNYDIRESYTFCFLPQALGITVARLLNWNMLRTFYLGRLFNLAFYVSCVYIAIKKTPVHKVLFGIMATLPIFMQQAASFSYDCYINGLTFVIVALLMKWMIQKEKIDKKEFILAFMANLMISPMKVVYGLFSFLYWFVPEENFGSRKNKIIGTLIVTAPALYQIVILLSPLIFRIVRKIFENVFLKQVYAETLSQPSAIEGDIYTFSYVMNHPLEMLAMFARTVRYNLKTWFYASFGRALSGNTLILPTYLVHTTLLILVIASLRDEGYIGSVFFRVVIIFLCIFAGLMMVGGMLISWTEINQEVIEDYGGPIIQGIQGRYFSPLLPYLFLIPNNPKIRISKKIDPYLLYTFILLVFEVVVYVLSYTFVN